MAAPQEAWFTALGAQWAAAGRAWPNLTRAGRKTLAVAREVRDRLQILWRLAVFSAHFALPPPVQRFLERLWAAIPRVPFKWKVRHARTRRTALSQMTLATA
eukprot:scaffold2059_cov342-Prasinococcus_capsulatus_cf.AAC.4